MTRLQQITIILVLFSDVCFLVWKLQSTPENVVQRNIELPQKLDHWIGNDVSIDPEILAAAHADQYIYREYIHELQGIKALVWINYSRTGQDQYHYPTACMIGSGWVEEKGSRVTLEQTDPEIIRYCFKQAQLQKFVYHGVITANPEQSIDIKLKQQWRFLLRYRGEESITIELFTDDESGLPESDKFIKAIFNHFQRKFSNGN